ncbi:MAG TPA: OmpA family protein, partial [bacterium]|nr:OmpA family protein [bacterium]
ARAASVKNYYVEKGISDSKMTTEGRGETQPIADNSTEAGRAENRRIEIDIR